MRGRKIQLSGIQAEYYCEIIQSNKVLRTQMLKSTNHSGKGVESSGESFQRNIEKVLELLCSGKPLILERFQVVASATNTSSYRNQSLGERHSDANQQTNQLTGSTYQNKESSSKANACSSLSILSLVGNHSIPHDSQGGKSQNGAYSSSKRSDCLKLISTHKIPQSKKFDAKEIQETPALQKEKRQYWSDADFNLLRAQSLLNFSRRRMAQILGRDDRLIFSKLQKHGNNLIEVEQFIRGALQQANYKSSGTSTSELINIDNHAKQSFQKIQKYFYTTREFWVSLTHTLSHESLRALTESAKTLETFIPAFLRVPESALTLQQLHVFITQGLTPEQAIQTANCIGRERIAHSRDNHYHSCQQLVVGGKPKSPNSSHHEDEEEGKKPQHTPTKRQLAIMAKGSETAVNKVATESSQAAASQKEKVSEEACGRKRDKKAEGKCGVKSPVKKGLTIKDHLLGARKASESLNADLNTPKFKASEMPCLQGQYSSNKDEAPIHLKRRKREHQSFQVLNFANITEEGQQKSKQMLVTSHQRQIAQNHTLPSSRPDNIASEDFDHFFNFLPQLEMRVQSKSMVKGGQQNIFLNDFHEGLDHYGSKYEPDPYFFTKYGGGDLSPHLPHHQQMLGRTNLEKYQESTSGPSQASVPTPRHHHQPPMYQILNSKQLNEGNDGFSPYNLFNQAHHLYAPQHLVSTAGKDHLVIPTSKPYYRPHLNVPNDPEEYSISNTTHEAPRDLLSKATLQQQHQHAMYDIRPSPLLEAPFLGLLHGISSNDVPLGDSAEDIYQDLTHEVFLRGCNGSSHA